MKEGQLRKARQVVGGRSGCLYHVDGGERVTDGAVSVVSPVEEPVDLHGHGHRPRSHVEAVDVQPYGVALQAEVNVLRHHKSEDVELLVQLVLFHAQGVRAGDVVDQLVRRLGDPHVADGGVRAGVVVGCPARDAEGHAGPCNLVHVHQGEADVPDEQAVVHPEGGDGLRVVDTTYGHLGEVLEGGGAEQVLHVRVALHGHLAAQVGEEGDEVQQGGPDLGDLQSPLGGEGVARRGVEGEEHHQVAVLPEHEVHGDERQGLRVHIVVQQHPGLHVHAPCCEVHDLELHIQVVLYLEFGLVEDEGKGYEVEEHTNCVPPLVTLEPSGGLELVVVLLVAVDGEVQEGRRGQSGAGQGNVPVQGQQLVQVVAVRYDVCGGDALQKGHGLVQGPDLLADGRAAGQQMASAGIQGVSGGLQGGTLVLQ